MSYLEMDGEYDPNVSPYLQRRLRSLAEVENAQLEAALLKRRTLAGPRAVSDCASPVAAQAQEQQQPALRLPLTHPFPCPQCKRRFARERDLQQHMEMKHAEAAE